MKKQAMSLAVTAALLGGAVSTTAQVQLNAPMVINEAGLGETLIYPFYSANDGNDTLINIVNTTGFVKAVKVRFIESQNSDEVLDFNLYLSPQDEWSAVITVTEDGGAQVRTVDNSCTVPAIPQVDVLANGDVLREQAFTNVEYSGDSFDDGISRTTEGYVEMIEMGQWSPTVGIGENAVHTAAGVPADCGALVAAWTSPLIASEEPGEGPIQGAWIADPAFDQRPIWNGGGLYGYAVLINVNNGTSFGMDADAILNFADLSEAALPDYHSNPGSVLPGLAQGQEFVTVFNAAQEVLVTAQMANGIDAVSALFMTDAIINDYIVDPAIAAQTDWVITFPTKKEYTNQADDEAVRPFNSVWGEVPTETGDPTQGGACESISMLFWDREEAVEVVPGNPVFSPQPEINPGDDLQICKEVNVLSFGTASAVEASYRIDYGVNELLEDFTEGWAFLDLTGDLLNDQSFLENDRILPSEDDTLGFLGLPATGFAVFEYTNGSITDPDGNIVAANYESSVDHKTVTTVVDLPD